jgi:hypothetical protein
MAGSSSEAAANAAPRWESAIARVTLALVALHLVDDSFLEPRPGTGSAIILSAVSFRWRG